MSDPSDQQTNFYGHRKKKIARKTILAQLEEGSYTEDEFELESDEEDKPPRKEFARMTAGGKLNLATKKKRGTIPKNKRALPQGSQQNQPAKKTAKEDPFAKEVAETDVASLLKDTLSEEEEEMSGGAAAAAILVDSDSEPEIHPVNRKDQLDGSRVIVIEE